MSQYGMLVFYRTTKLPEFKKIICKLIKFINPEDIIAIYRSKIESRDWDRFLSDQPLTPREEISIPSNIREVSELYIDGLSLEIDFYKSKIGRRISNAVEEEINEDIHGGFKPIDVSITIGWHDIFECAEDEDGHLFARAFLSISFFGYFTPNDWETFREMVFELAEMKVVKKELEEVVGPLEQCIYWVV